MAKINHFVHKYSNCKTLWASPRMSYDVINALKTNTDIITIPDGIFKKIKIIGKNLREYSLETVQMFRNDAIKSGIEF